jgi:nicotinate-nucleotide adenylyltransferase
LSFDKIISPRFDALIDAVGAVGAVGAPGTAGTADTAGATTGTKPFRLGLFGGTFDPVHVGHLHIAECAREQFSLDGVLFIPTGQPVRKLGAGFSAADDRHAMLKAAVAGNACFDVSRIEIERAGVTYTIDTLRAIKERYGEKAVLFFIAGFDAVFDMSTWKNADEIGGLVTVLSAKRAISHDIEPSLLHNGGCFDIHLIDSCFIDVSSHELREWVRKDRSIQYLVPDATYSYIRKQRLYRG